MAADDEKENSTTAVGDVEKDLENPESASEQPPANGTGTPDKSTSTTLETVPRSERRGLLGRICFIPEVTNPYSYGNATKWWMTLIVSFASITSSTGSSIFYRE